MFAGLFRHENGRATADWTTGEKWLAALYPRHRPDVSGYHQDALGLLVEADIHNTPDSHARTAVPLVAGSVQVAFWGRLDNRKDLAAQLAPDRPLGQVPDAELVLRGWRLWGEAVPEQLIGDFAFAIIDTDQKTAFLARDPVGIKPLYYWPHAEALLFASSPVPLLNMADLRATPDEAWITRYIAGFSTSHDRTAYQEIRKLSAGHALTVRGGEVHLRRYHAWRDDAPDVFVRDQEQVTAYRAALENCMAAQCASEYPLGVEISGGIDSSTVIGYVGSMLSPPGDRVHGFGFALLEEEPEYILAASQAAGIRHNHIDTESYGQKTPCDALIRDDLKILGYPEEHGNATAHRSFYLQCQSLGIRTLLSGYGGDEVVTNYAHHIHRELVDKGAYRAASELMVGNALTRPLRLVKRMWQDRKDAGVNPRFLQARKAQWPAVLLTEEAARIHDIEREYMALAQYDAPYRNHNDWIIKGLMQMPYVPTRLENCSLMAASYGIDYRWPLWDQRLVQRYLSTPVVERAGPGGVGRYLHRRAITGTVPDKVAWKQSKSMGDQAGRRRIADDDELRIYRDMEANLHPTLKALIDNAKLSRAISRLSDLTCDDEGGLPLRRQLKAIRWLNVWLHG